MTNPFEIGDQGGQFGSDQAAAFDPDGKRSLAKLPTTRAPSGMTVMLLNRQRHRFDVNLLDHTGLAPERGFQPMAALGTKIDTVIERPGVDGLGRERLPFVFRVSGLATDLAVSLPIGGRRLGRFDDIGRGRLGRCRGILPGRRELLLEPCDCGLERSEPRRQSATIRTRLPCPKFHRSLC